LPPDVVIVGAGPAGATAALVLARAGVRVTLLDRARFPRHKLCGDTLNPGTLAILRRLGLEESLTRGALRLEGMRLTGPRGVAVEGRYPTGFTAAALTRRVFDHRLLLEAIGAGAAFEEGVTVTAALRDTGPVTAIAGVAARQAGGGPCVFRARVTIAADGRTSVLASSLELSRRPSAARRWAIGAYFEGVRDLQALGEMHVRPHHYIGVAPLPGGLTNAILVVPIAAARERGQPLSDRLVQELRGDAELSQRFAGARAVTPATVLGPMAVDVQPPACPGLLLAGDAAGFIDPMTGDGMRFAIAGGELAARAALKALDHGWDHVHRELAGWRRRVFGRKWMFNRAMRRLTESPASVGALASCAPLASRFLSRAIVYAGDVPQSGRAEALLHRHPEQG
jgi:menaquinone-9 beta-reductase